MQLEVGISRRRLSYDESRSARLGLRIVETEVATCSIGDLRTLLSPHMRAKKPRNHASALLDRRPLYDGAGDIDTIADGLVMIAGDFLAMSLTTNNVRPSPMPNAWRIGSLATAGVTMGVCQLAFCTGVLAAGHFGLKLGTDALRTLAFAALVFSSQATIYAIRGRRHLWGPRPGLWVAVSSVADVMIASIFAVAGIFMTPLVVAGVFASAALFAAALAVVKVLVFARFRIA
jgi:hypothetical protein